MELKVKLEVFEGPLDLLLHLLDKNKVSIYDIPIVEITNQYLEYIREMQRQDLNIMSEFLVMAATLLEIKSKWLLPKEETEDEDEVDPRAELFKYMSQELKDRQIDAGRRLYKNQSIPEEVRSYEEPLDLEELTRGWDLKKLHAIFESVMRKQVDKMDPIRSRFGKIEREEVSLDENNNVYSITIHNENLNNKIGDYPIITVEEAKNRLLEQRYWMSATYPPNQDNISKIELIYKTSNYHKYFAPYYCF